MKEHLRTCPDKMKIEASFLERQLKAAKMTNKVFEKVPDEPIQYDDEEEDWDKLEAVTYKPQAAIKNRKVLRNIQNATPSQRKEFRKQEAERFKRLEEKRGLLEEEEENETSGIA